jgi:hypothetical protein
VMLGEIKLTCLKNHLMPLYKIVFLKCVVYGIVSKLFMPNIMATYILTRESFEH